MRRQHFRNRLGLLFCSLHDELLEGTSNTTFTAVDKFIEPPHEAIQVQARNVLRLKRKAGGKRAARRLLRCRHGKADGGISSCFICASDYRRWVIPQVIAYCQKNVETTVVVVLIKAVPAGKLQSIDLARERDALRKRLLRANITVCIGNFEVAFKPTKQSWVFHAHLLVFGPYIAACKRLKDALDLPRAVHCEILCPHRRVRQVSYIFKFTTYYRHPSSPRLLPLPEDQLVELICWRMNYRFLDHLVLLGFQRRGAIVPGLTFQQMLKHHKSFGDVETSKTPPPPPANAQSRARKLALNNKSRKHVNVCS